MRTPQNHEQPGAAVARVRASRVARDAHARVLPRLAELLNNKSCQDSFQARYYNKKFASNPPVCSRRETVEEMDCAPGVLDAELEVQIGDRGAVQQREVVTEVLCNRENLGVRRIVWSAIDRPVRDCDSAVEFGGPFLLRRLCRGPPDFAFSILDPYHNCRGCAWARKRDWRKGIWDWARRQGRSSKEALEVADCAAHSF
jgi:hypothetical protein